MVKIQFMTVFLDFVGVVGRGGGGLFTKDEWKYGNIVVFFIWAALKNGSTVYFSRECGRFNDSRMLRVQSYLSLLEAWGTTSTEDSWHPEELYLESRRDIPLISPCQTSADSPELVTLTVCDVTSLTSCLWALLWTPEPLALCPTVHLLRPRSMAWCYGRLSRYL